MLCRLAVLTTVLLSALLSCLAPARADDAQIAAALKQKGATVTEAHGVVNSVDVREPAKFSEDDFRAIGQLTHLKSLSLGVGFDGRNLALFSGLVELEYLSTNGMQFSDEQLAALKPLRALRNVKFFHPGKNFSGTGLAQLVGLANLRQLTVAGAFTFGDEGLAAIGKLAQLEELRVWHAGQTNAGLAALAGLPKLKSLTLGQRLTYKPPACPDGATIALVVRLKSLETLDLQEARLTAADLKQLEQLPALKKLTLTGIEIAPADLDQLRGDLPRIQIGWTEPTAAFHKRIEALFGGK